MANTTYFGWETPDDTDLVKDGAAAIRTLGQAIDTSLQDLEGGTTGQVLSKTSNTDMDFTWVTTDDANAIQNAIVDAKGDIIAASANDTPARLAVGTNNQRLVAASGEATGLKYVADTQNTVIDAAGDLVYGTAADTLGRLAIGTAGQVLQVNSGATAPEWATAASGGGMTLLNTGGTALTGASITLSSISTAYTNLYLVLKNVYLATAGGNCSMQLNGDTGANYSYSYIRYREATVGVGYNYSDTQHAFLFEASASSSASKLTNCEVVLPRYTDTDIQPIYSRSYGSNATQVINYTSFGSYDSSAAITEIKLTPQYNFSGGTAYLYGVK
jgi:hypothetical protein